MSTFWNHFIHAPYFLITWSMFFGCGIILYSIYIVRNRTKFSFKSLFHHCVPFDIRSDKSFHIDVKIYIIGKFAGFLFAIPGAFVTTGVCGLVSQGVIWVFPSWEVVKFTYYWAAFCTIIMFLFVEFADYSYHYMEHKTPVLWELHKVHHSALFLNPLTSKRGHPLAMTFAGMMRGAITGIPAGIFIFVFGITILEALSLSIVASKIFSIATLDPLKHSHYPISLGLFDRILISPHMHQIHHSKTKAHWDKNFGTNLSIFDWIFRTAYKPKEGEKAVYGISGHSTERLQSYNSLYGAYIQPLVRIGTIAKKRIKGPGPDTTEVKFVAARDSQNPTNVTLKEAIHPAHLPKRM